MAADQRNLLSSLSGAAASSATATVATAAASKVMSAGSNIAASVVVASSVVTPAVSAAKSFTASMAAATSVVSAGATTTAAKTVGSGLAHVIDVPFEWLGAVMGGVPADYLKLVFTFLASYPLAHIYVRLLPPSPESEQEDLKNGQSNPGSGANTPMEGQRFDSTVQAAVAKKQQQSTSSSTPTWAPHVFSLAVSLFYLVGLFRMRWGTLRLLGDAIAIWVMAQATKGERGTRMPWLAFGLLMADLTATHLYRNLSGVPITEIEVSGPQMVIVMKLATFAWNVYDGRRKSDDLDQTQKATAIPEIPGLLEFLGFCFFFPSLMIGPTFDFASYRSLVRGTLFIFPSAVNASSTLAATRAASAVAHHRPPRAPAGRKTTAYRKLATGIVFMGLYAVYGASYDYSATLDNAQWPRSIGRRWLFVQLCGLVARTKYYGAWSLTEGACILAGLGFNGYDPETRRTRWDRVTNVDIIGIEGAQSFKVLFDSWNCGANVWLRETVYKRVTPKGRRPGMSSTLLTFFTSAFWHGVDAGYYLAFVTAGFATSLGRPLRKLVRPYFMGSPIAKRVYDVVGWFIVQSLLNYLVAPFLLLGWRDSIRAWHRYGWYGHIAIAGSLAFFRFGGARWLAKNAADKNVVPTADDGVPKGIKGE